MQTTLNIGLNIGDGTRKVSPAVAMAALALAGAAVLRHTIAQSATEVTLVAELAEPLPRETLHAVSVVLEQDCIAQRHVDGVGELIGPRAAEWGEFNPAYFLGFPDIAQHAA